MDFILGIFTGMFFMIALGAWISERDKKRREKEVDRLIRIWHAQSTVNDTLNGPFGKEVKERMNTLRLSDQLQSAIDRDDFEEAARIRDLINKG